MPISAIGIPQQQQAEREVGGQSLPADESERRDRSEQAADPDRRVQEAHARLAEVEQLESGDDEQNVE